MRALITGAAGFVGQWVGRELVERGWDVAGTALEATPPPIQPNDPLASIRWHMADVRRSEDLSRLLDATKPDAIFHLAGVAFVPAAQADRRGARDERDCGGRLLADLRRTCRGVARSGCSCGLSGEQTVARPIEMRVRIGSQAHRSMPRPSGPETSPEAS